MINQSVDTVNNVINALSAKLAIPTHNLLKLIPNLGYKDYIAEIISLVIFVVSVIIAWCMFKKCDDENLQDDIRAVFITGFFTFAVIALFSLLYFIFDLSSVIFWIVNPNAWALNYILNMIH